MVLRPDIDEDLLKKLMEEDGTEILRNFQDICSLAAGHGLTLQ